MDTDATSMTLLGQLRAGRESPAWPRFYAIYAPLIQGWLRRRGIPEDVAEDVRQEVLRKVYEEIGNFDHNGRVGSFRKWLRTVMQHRLRTIQRKSWRESPETKLDWSDVVDQLNDDQSDLSRLWDAEHDAFLIDRLLSLVAKDFKEQSLTAFRRVVLRGEDITSVAEDLGMTPNAIRIAQSRILASLRRVGEGILY